MRTHRKLALLALIATLTGCEYDEGGSLFGGGGEGAPLAEGTGGEGGGGGGGIASNGGSCNNANEACTAGSCGGEGGTMLPGANCQPCHSGGGGGEDEGGSFSIAGTVFTDIGGSGKSSGASVFVTDANGQSVTLSTNSAGNFYTSANL
ncbi:MAG: hypothetical protein GXP62_19340, partial [Oligoflexia bacterium]|nr:hypothetical protein [Oligoflexia bacterium]